MFNIWVKWVAASGGTRLILAFLYAFVSLNVSLNHTCRPSSKDVYCCHSESASHQSQIDGHVAAQSITVFNQNTSATENNSNDLYCLACLYSLTSKAFKLYSNTSVCLAQVIFHTQFISQLSFTKQLECLTSVSLRAPPMTIS